MPTTAIWKNTPNKKDHLTNGYTSKTLFNFQYPDGGLYVGFGANVIETLIANGTNYKGSCAFPSNYFNCDDGRTLKISMSFYKFLDGNDINFDLGLGPNTLANVNGTGVSTDGTFELCEFVWYFSKYNDKNNNANFISNGNVIYSTTVGPISISMCKIEGSNDTVNIADALDLQIRNNCHYEIIVRSLIVEEIS